MKSKIGFSWPFIIGLVCVVGISGCDIINPDEPQPTTIHLQPFQFQIGPGQGTALQDIPEIWVYANSNFYGVFAPPVDIPFLGVGPTRFTFRPGIRNNGLQQDPITYPLFTGYTVDTELAAGTELDVAPVTQYTNTCFFSLLADFETGNDFTDNRDTIEASRVIQSEADVFEGSYAGQIILSESASFIEVGHAVPLTSLPTDGRKCYLEFRYKSEAEMSIGILGINTSGDSFSNFFYLVKPSSDWNMLYIELTEFLRLSSLPAYKILFRSQYPANAEKPEYNIFLDNLKVVHLTE